MRMLEPVRRTELDDFPSVLSQAIEASGFTLDRLVRQLTRRGLRTSIATLSYWRSGRSRPERPESMRSVRALEEVLLLPEGTLISLLGPRRPRGRRAARPQPVIDVAHLWGHDAPDGADAIVRLEPPPADRLTHLSVHDDLFLDAQGRESRLRCRIVVRAEVDGVDRLEIIHRADPTDRDAPRITSVTHGRVSDSRIQQDGAFLRADILFDRALLTGETALVEYEVTPEPKDPSTGSERRFTRAATQYVLQVTFDRDAIPARCAEFHRPGLVPDTAVRHDLWIGASAAAHLAALDVRPGIVGMRWEWE